MFKLNLSKYPLLVNKLKAIQEWINELVNLKTDQRQGTAILFDQDSVYGSIATPETGNITASYTGANLGTVALIIHDNGTEPTYPATWQKISGTYSTTVTNYISAVYLDATHVKYSIYQDA